jgi:hypothetical protein
MEEKGPLTFLIPHFQLLSGHCLPFLLPPSPQQLCQVSLVATLQTGELRLETLNNTLAWDRQSMVAGPMCGGCRQKGTGGDCWEWMCEDWADCWVQ